MLSCEGESTRVQVEVSEGMRLDSDAVDPRKRELETDKLNSTFDSSCDWLFYTLIAKEMQASLPAKRQTGVMFAAAFVNTHSVR